MQSYLIRIIMDVFVILLFLHTIANWGRDYNLLFGYNRSQTHFGTFIHHIIPYLNEKNHVVNKCLGHQYANRVIRQRRVTQDY